MQNILELVERLTDEERGELDAELYAPVGILTEASAGVLTEDQLDAELVRRASEALSDSQSVEPADDVIRRMRAGW